MTSKLNPRIFKYTYLLQNFPKYTDEYFKLIKYFTRVRVSGRSIEKQVRISYDCVGRIHSLRISPELKGNLEAIQDQVIEAMQDARNKAHSIKYYKWEQYVKGDVTKFENVDEELRRIIQESMPTLAPEKIDPKLDPDNDEYALFPHIFDEPFIKDVFDFDEKVKEKYPEMENFSQFLYSQEFKDMLTGEKDIGDAENFIKFFPERIREMYSVENIEKILKEYDVMHLKDDPAALYRITEQLLSDEKVTYGPSTEEDKAKYEMAKKNPVDWDKEYEDHGREFMEGIIEEVDRDEKEAEKINEWEDMRLSDLSLDTKEAKEEAAEFEAEVKDILQQFNRLLPVYEQILKEESEKIALESQTPKKEEVEEKEEEEEEDDE